MKKLIALILGVSLFSVNTWADIQMNYVKDGMKTSASSYSLAGSADPNYPLYINGKKVETTSEGYFSYYVSLAQGVNLKILQPVRPIELQELMGHLLIVEMLILRL